MTSTKLSSSFSKLELPPHTKIVTNPAAAAFLSDPEKNAYLSPFLDQDMTLVVAARALELPLNQMHYWAKRLLNLGLIEVRSTQKRGGRPIQHYRSTAPAFFVPFSATPLETLEAQLIHDNLIRQRQMSTAHARALGELPPDYGTLISRLGTDKNRIRFQAIHGSSINPLIFSTWLARPFQAEDAQKLHAELQTLTERYANLPEPDEGRMVYLRLALVPL